MTEERWDLPSERLKRMASPSTPSQFRECGRCTHRHAKAERCGYPLPDRFEADTGAPVTCECVL